MAARHRKRTFWDRLREWCGPSHRRQGDCHPATSKPVTDPAQGASRASYRQPVPLDGWCPASRLEFEAGIGATPWQPAGSFWASRGRTEPDAPTPGPVPSPDDRPALADLAAASRTPSLQEFIASRHAEMAASIEASSRSGQANLASAVERLVSARLAMGGDDPAATLGQALDFLAGPDAKGLARPLHGTGGAEGATGSEDVCYCSPTKGFDPGNPHPFPHRRNIDE